MLDSDQYYLAREADARATAGEQTLENVRQKHLTAAATWAALAHSARKMTELRARRLVERSGASQQPMFTGNSLAQASLLGAGFSE